MPFFQPLLPELELAQGDRHPDEDTASPPKMMKATIAATLTAANQNSLSAKILTEKKLERKIKIMKTRLQIETGTEGNQCRMIIPAAVN